jgi:hypothetical protein
MRGELRTYEDWRVAVDCKRENEPDPVLAFESKNESSNCEKNRVIVSS